MKSIIVGTDFSEGSYVALDLAVDVANRMQCDINLVWVRREKMLFTGEQMDMLTTLAKEKLQSLCEKYAPKMTSGSIHSSIISGRVSTAIAEAARRELAPMIVIGTKKQYFESTWVRNEWTRFLYKIDEEDSKNQQTRKSL